MIGMVTVLWLTQVEIYRIVSSKALDNGEGGQAPVGGIKINMPPSDSPDAKNNKCC
jgi:hypothetical protein